MKTHELKRLNFLNKKSTAKKFHPMCPNSTLEGIKI
jgi:hypothetical protein